MKLYNLIWNWIKGCRPLNEHFTVALPDQQVNSMVFGWIAPANYPKPEGWITYTCANTSSYRQTSGVDRLINIYETYIEDAGVKIEAADPQLLEKLELILRRKHDRTGEFNIVTFRDDCGVKLRDCRCVEAFCGC